MAKLKLTLSQIYSKTECKWCKKTKNVLTENNFEFEEINLDNDEKRQKFYKNINDVENLSEENKILSTIIIFGVKWSL